MNHRPDEDSSMRHRAQIEAAELAARRYALSIPRRSAAGDARLGVRSGSSFEFQEYREYQPGDDLRHLDWSAYGRSDRLIVKQFRDEVQPHVDLLLDGSRSMALSGSAKAEATVGMLAFLTRAAARAGLDIGVWLAADGCRRWVDGAHDLDFGYRGSLPESLDRVPPRWRPRGIRLMVSDLLWAAEPRAVLARLARGAAAVWVVQLLAAEDVDPDRGRTGGFRRLEDSETGEIRDVLLDAAALARYRRAFAAHRESWHRACREVGAVMVTLVAEQLVDGWRPEALEELVRQGIVVAA